MIFGRIPIREAEGIILAHAVEIAPGKLLKKGYILTQSDIKSIENNGVETVIGARLENTDMAEDDAAAAIAAPCAGENVTVKPPFTGRANLFAAVRGVAVVDERLVTEINHIDETITVAT
ncbi:hypothetical protein, partial [uncultured Sneathiella sp.]|uniref:hypothetical protein n=1 Tax=uncultured Sneathiella sp. TaxID=879315 RepID=UPI0030D7B220